MPEAQKYIKTKVWNPDEETSSNQGGFQPQGVTTPAQFKILSQNRNESLNKLRDQYNEGNDEGTAALDMAIGSQQMPFLRQIVNPMTQDLGEDKVSPVAKIPAAVLHGLFSGGMAPYAEASEAVSNTGAIGKEVVSGVNKAMNLPFEGVKTAFKGYNALFNKLGLKIPDSWVKNIANPETLQKINDLAAEGTALFLIGKGHSEVKNYINQNIPKGFEPLQTNVSRETGVQNENQNEKTNFISIEQRKPVEQPTAEQTEGGTPQREGEGVQQEKTPQALKWIEPETKNVPKGQESTFGENQGTSPISEEPQLSGIAQRIREQRADVTSMKASEIGQGYSPEEEISRGKDLIKQGIDPDQVISDFKKDKKISDDTMSVVRVKADQLAHETNLIADEKGIDSPEYKEALKKEEDFLNEVKPMQTLWSNIGKAQMGGTEIDTGTFNGLRRAFKEKSGKEFTEDQSTVAKQFSDRIKALTDRETESNKRFQELKEKYDKIADRTELKTSDQKTIRANSKALANKIRTARIHKPGAFYAATPATLAWDLGVETVAKSIELGGEIGQAISDGIKALKETDWYKGLGKDKQDEAEKQFTDWHKDQLSKKLEDFNFADKQGNKFTPNEANAVWKHAKDNYIDKGTTDFDDMVDGVSKDTGLSKDQVRNAIAQPKALRDVTDEIYKARYARKRIQDNAKAWVKSADTPKVIRFLKGVPNIFFGLKVFGHGTVGMITHAGSEIFRPSGWNTYFPNFIKQFKLAYGSTAEYEKAMSDLQDDPNYIFWKRAGLAVDPTRIYDDYMEVGKYFGKLGEIGNKGFQILKIHRLETAKSIYEHLSDVEKADPNTQKEIAKIVNHSTGTSNVITPKTLNVAFFAPRLEASRWARLIVEPTKAIGTFTKWATGQEIKPSEKVAAKLVAKRSGEMLATGVALLTANQAILSLSGSKEKINFTDYSKSDWLRFKAGSKVIDVSGGMLSTMQFIGKLVTMPFTEPKKVRGVPEAKSDTAFNLTGRYLRGKLSPFISTAVDFAFGKTYMGDVMPTSSEKPDRYHEKLTWKKYLLENQTPIPIAEGIQDVIQQMKDKGMNAPQIKEILIGAGLSVVSGGTGARVREDFKPKSSGGVRP
jgi:hypothetical protein